MVVCAAVGLVLLVVGAWDLPGPASLVHAQEPVGRPAATAASTPSSAADAQSPTLDRMPTPTAWAVGTLVPDSGPGTYERAKVSAPTTADRGRLYRFDVRVEKGVDLDPDEVARALEKTLDDPRSWRSTGKLRFSLVAAGERADLHAYLVTPGPPTGSATPSAPVVRCPARRAARSS